MKICKKH